MGPAGPEYAIPLPAAAPGPFLSAARDSMDRARRADHLCPVYRHQHGRPANRHRRRAGRDRGRTLTASDSGQSGQSALLAESAFRCESRFASVAEFRSITGGKRFAMRKYLGLSVLGVCLLVLTTGTTAFAGTSSTYYAGKNSQGQKLLFSVDQTANGPRFDPFFTTLVLHCPRPVTLSPRDSSSSDSRFPSRMGSSASRLTTSPTGSPGVGP